MKVNFQPKKDTLPGNCTFRNGHLPPSPAACWNLLMQVPSSYLMDVREGPGVTMRNSLAFSLCLGRGAGWGQRGRGCRCQGRGWKWGSYSRFCALGVCLPLRAENGIPLVVFPCWTVLFELRHPRPNQGKQMSIKHHWAALVQGKQAHSGFLEGGGFAEKAGARGSGPLQHLERMMMEEQIWEDEWPAWFIQREQQARPERGWGSRAGRTGNSEPGRTGNSEPGGQEILKPPRGRRELEMASEDKLGGQRIQDGLQS